MVLLMGSRYREYVLKRKQPEKLARSTEAFYKRFKTLTNCASSIQPLISQSSVCICNVITLIQIQSGNLEPNIFYFLSLIYNNKEHLKYTETEKGQLMQN